MVAHYNYDQMLNVNQYADSRDFNPYVVGGQAYAQAHGLPIPPPASERNSQFTNGVNTVAPTNRDLALSFSKLKFGDALVANIAGTSAFVGITDDLTHALPALNNAPYTYNSFQQQDEGDVISQNPDGSVTIRAPDGTIYNSTAPGIYDRIASVLGNLPGISTITKGFSPGNWSDLVKQSGQYLLLAIVGLILLAFGIHQLTK